MSNRDELADRCITLSSVPSDYGQDALVSLLRARKVSTKKINEVPGGEADENYERWIVMLDSSHDAKDLYTNVKHEEVEFNGDWHTISFIQSVPCELPEEWIGEDSDDDLEEQVHESLEQNGAGLFVGTAEFSDQSSGADEDHDNEELDDEVGIDMVYHKASHLEEDEVEESDVETPPEPEHVLEEPTEQTYVENAKRHNPEPAIFEERIEAEMTAEELEQSDSESDDGMDGDPAPPELPEKPQLKEFLSEGQGEQPQHPSFAASGFYHNVPGTENFMPPGPGGQHPQHPPPPGVQPHIFSPPMGQYPPRFPGQQGQNQPMYGQPVSMFDPRTQQWMPMFRPNMGMRVHFYPGSPQGQQQHYSMENVGDPPPYNSAEMGSDSQPNPMSYTDVKYTIPTDGQRNSPIVTDQEIAFEKLRTQDNTDSQSREDSPAPTKVVLKNLPKNVDGELLEMLFESKKRLNVGTVSSVQMNEDKTEAVVEFADPGAVDIVLKKSPITIKKTPVDVELYDPTKDTEDSQETSEEKQPSRLLVSGLPNVDEEFLEMFFENKKKFGGIEIASIDLDEEEGAATIEFKDPQAVQVILEKQPIIIMGVEVQVKEYVPEVVKDYAEDLVGGEGETVKILVTNLPPKAVDEEVLGMFFENKRKCGGGDVATVELIEEYSAAVIEFEECEAVQTVMGKTPIVIYKTELEVREYNPKTAPQDTVEVHGDFTESEKDILEMYFESKKKSGGDEFESLIIAEDEEGGVAYIKYATEKVAKRVVAQGTHSVSKKQLSVKIYQPEDPLTEYLKRRYAADDSDDKDDKKKEDKDRKKKAKDTITQEPELGPKTTRSVKVRGMKKVKSEETVQYYFESRRSGGGPIKNLETDEEDDNVIYITFETETAAKSVSERGSHQVDGCDLSVSLYTPPPPRPIYEDKLLIKGLKPTTTKDCLFNFLEAKSGGNVPTQEQYGEKEGVRLVTFENSIDFERLQQNVKKLEGADLTIARVQVSNCIYVSNYDETLGKDTLELYFENTNRSGGGQVQKAVFNEEEGYWLVYFIDYNVIDSVLSREHRLGNQKLTVKLFVECLGRSQGPDGEPTLKMPDPITVPGTHPQKIKFILNSHVSKAAIERQMHDCHTTIRWPQTDIKDQVQVKLECTLTPKTKNCYKLAKEWKQQATGNFEDFLKTITVKQIPVSKDLWTVVMGNLKEITIPNPEAVAVFVEKDQGLVTTVGMKRALEQLASDIQKRIAKIEEQANRDKQKTKETVANMKQLHTKMLLAIKFPSKMEDKYKDFKMKINQNKNEIAFDGIAKDISAVKLEMYEQTNTLAQKTFTDISQQCLDMYILKQVKEYIVKHLKENNVSAVWEVADNKLVICSTCEQSLGNCASLIRDAVQEKVVPLAPANRSATSTDEWDSLVTDMEGRYPDRVKITVSGMSKIVVTATDDVLQSVVDVVKKFLDANSILDDHVPLSSSITKLLSHHHKQEVDNIAKGLVSDHVQITWGKNGFNIKGNQRGVSNAKTQLHNLAAKVQTKDYTIERSGLGPYFSTSQGRDSIRSVESNLPCMINIKGQDDDDYSDDDDDDFSASASSASQGSDLPPGMRQHAYCPTPDGRKIFTAQGDLTYMEVDVLVNTSDRKMKLIAGLGKAIVTKGGNVIKQACADFINNYGVLEEGEVFMSPGGNLKAKAVIHVVGPTWKNGQEKERDRLKEAVSKVMKQASMQNFKSMAMPAISCGTFGFPSKVAASVIAQAVQNFFREEQDSSIEIVYLCDVKPETIEAFTDALETCFGRVKRSPKKTTPKQQKSPPQPRPRPRTGVQVLPSLPQKIPGTKAVIGKITVTIVKGELAKEKVNAVVNTTADNLDLSNGAVSKSLLTAAGGELQKEIKNNHPDKLQFGEIVVTKGYNLNCDIVLHTALQNYDGGPAIQTLQKVMDRCLTQASKQNCKKIAFPAIGTGNLKYPKDKVAMEMFTAVETFMKKNPKTSLTDVKFVVYHKDTATVKAFEQEELRWMSGSRVVSQARKTRDFESKYSRTPTEESDPGSNGSDSDTDYEKVGSDDDYDYGRYPSSPSAGNPFGDIKVFVKSGDITREACDCIVNSSNEDLDLSRGGVSQALLKKGGKQLSDQLSKKKHKMKKDQITMTTAPGLQCSHIIHIVAQEGSKAWKKIMDKCLQYAEKKQMACVAFPALGTGMSMKADEIAGIMVQSLVEFQATKPKYVKEVRFVIFQKTMQQTFQKAVEDAKAGDQQGIMQKVWGGVKAMAGFNSSRSNPEQASGRRGGNRHASTSNQVIFIIYAMSKEVIDKAIKRLETVIDKAIVQKKFADSTIQRLDQNQIMEIQAMAKQQNVELKVTGKSSCIEISGIANKVLDMSDKIYEVLREAEKIEHQKNEASLIANMTQWFFMEVTDIETKMTPYDTTSNRIIEKAYQAGDKTVELVDSNQVVYVVDFKKMEECPKDTPPDTVQIIRRDRLKEGSFEAPSTWDKMVDGENLKVVALKNTDKEYTDMETKFKGSAGGNYTVQKIERVQNKTLWQQYQAKKKQLEQQNPPGTQNERQLWHGFAVDAMDSINAHGFNRSYCGKNATAYGDGVYFAVNANYSCSDTYSRPDASGVKHMFYCHVLTGEHTAGRGGMRVPPQKPSGGTTALYDSVSGPGMFIIFNDTQAYPEYSIHFKT